MEYRDSIDFTNGIPRSIWIDGEAHGYEEIVPLRSNMGNTAYSQMTASQLSVFQQNAIKHESDYFGIDDWFVILGSITINGENVIFAYNVHYFGPTLGRAIGRLLLFNERGIFLGMYGGVNETPWQIKHGGKSIEFFVDYPEYGNVIDFSKGIPRSIWIDGEIHEYEEIVPLRRNRSNEESQDNGKRRAWQGRGWCRSNDKAERWE